MKVKRQVAGSYHEKRKKGFRNEEMFQFEESKSDLMKLRSRIIRILDEQFHEVFLSMEKQNQIDRLMDNHSSYSRPREVIINESRLEEWAQMFKQEILVIKQKDQTQQKEQICSKIDFPKPFFQEKERKHLFSIEKNQINIFESNPNAKDSQNIWKKTSYEFPEHVVKPHSSLTYIDDLKKVILIGGSKQTNPNVKSSKILSFRIDSEKLQRLTNLPYGLSSHSAVYHKVTKSILIIGGNKNHSIVTRGCFRLWLQDGKVEQISCLNYPVSSHTCILWREDWIYKFGGVGQAFGQWNTSPYIQRYSIELNEWEVVNPSIGPNLSQALTLNNMFLAYSTAYVCQNSSKIFVFGGYSINGEFKNHGFSLQINQSDSSQDEPNHEHFIEDYGLLEASNFNSMTNQIAFIDRRNDSQIHLFGLHQSQDSNEVGPILIHKFSH